MDSYMFTFPITSTLTAPSFISNVVNGDFTTNSANNLPSVPNCLKIICSYSFRLSVSKWHVFAEAGIANSIYPPVAANVVKSESNAKLGVAYSVDAKLCKAVFPVSIEAKPSFIVAIDSMQNG